MFHNYKKLYPSKSTGRIKQMKKGEKIGKNKGEEIVGKEKEVKAKETKPLEQIEPIAQEMEVKPLSSDRAVVQYRMTANEIFDHASKLIIISDIDLTATIGAIKKIGVDREKVIEKRDFILKPIQEHLDLISSEFDRILDPMKDAEQIYRQKIKVYQVNGMKKKEEDQKKKIEEIQQQKANEKLDQIKLEKKVDADDIWNIGIDDGLEFPSSITPEVREEVVAPAIPPLVPKKTIKTDEGSSTISTNWKITVVDPKTLLQAIIDGKQPMYIIEFQVKHLRSMVTAANGKIEIPGCTIEKDYDVRIR